MDKLRNTNGTVIVAGGYSCGGCAELGSSAKTIESEFPGTEFFYVSAETDGDVFREKGIDRIPCTIVLKGGNEVARCYGYQPPEILSLWLKNKIGLSAKTDPGKAKK